MEQDIQAAPPEQAAAVFPQDEANTVPVSFVAETAFDCDEGGAIDWPSLED